MRLFCSRNALPVAPAREGMVRARICLLPDNLTTLVSVRRKFAGILLVYLWSLQLNTLPAKMIAVIKHNSPID